MFPGVPLYPYPADAGTAAIWSGLIAAVYPPAFPEGWGCMALGEPPVYWGVLPPLVLACYMVGLMPLLASSGVLAQQPINYQLYLREPLHPSITDFA